MFLVGKRHLGTRLQLPGGRRVTGTVQSLHAENFTILVVDDNTTNLLCLKQILLTHGYRVMEAADGYGALEAAERQQPELILLDVMMPGIDGFETCRRLKANRVTRDIPIIFITALSNSSDMVKGLELGGADYLTKPYQVPEVIARIRTQLRVVALNREMRRAFEFQESEVVRRTAELEKAQREIITRRQFLEAVLENVPDAIITLDERHHVVDWNPGAVGMFGYSPEEARGKHLDTLVARGQSLAEAGEKTQQVMGGQWVAPFETVRQRRDATSIHVIAGGSPIMINGRMAGAVAVYTDISAMKRTEEELRRSHERFLTVMESIDATIYVADMATHEILFMNRQMMQESGGDFTGGVCWRDLRGRSGPCPSCPNPLLFDEEGKPRTGCSWEDYLPQANRWYRHHNRAIKWVDQRLVRLHMATEITDQKRMEQERKEYERRIQQLQKMEAIGTLAGGIAHDFNNILAAVFGYAELAVLQTGENQVLQRNLSGILEAARRAKELVQQILLFSRQGEQELKPLQMRPLIKEALKMLRSSLPATIQIKQQLQGDFANILANPTQIHQIVMNLCANAAQAMEEDGGVLTVSLFQTELTEEDVRHHPGRAAGTYLKLRVQDTGRGIPADLLDKIYNPYFTTKAKGQGTGLGLSVVHGIVQSYSGIIEVGSEPGRGTVFEVFLPAIEMEAVREELPVLNMPGGREHILLVDDEEVLIEVLGDMLRLLGYRVTVTASSVEALSLFQRNPDDFDLLITDMTMPELTGERLTAEVRARRPDLPVIICTGYNRRLSDNGPKVFAVQAILMKPVEQIELARTVRAVLDGEDLKSAVA